MSDKRKVKLTRLDRDILVILSPSPCTSGWYGQLYVERTLSIIRCWKRYCGSIVRNSTKKLLSLGLVEEFHSSAGPAYQTTDAGKEVVKEELVFDEICGERESIDRKNIFTE